MAKPFMCGDEPATYIPAGGCDCNYTIQEYDFEDETDYKLLQDGEQVGDTIVVPKYDDECNCNYMINSLEVSDPDAYVAQYALVQDGVVSGDIINIPKQEGGGGGGGDECNCDYRIEPVETSTYQAAYKLTLDGVQKGSAINIPKYPTAEIIETHSDTVASSDPGTDDVIIWSKYSNGIAEVWRTVHLPSNAGNQQGSSGIYAEVTSGRSFPGSLFVATPFVFAGCYWGTGYCWCNVSSVTSSEFNVMLFKLNSVSAKATVRVHAVGRWKTIS